MKHCKEVLKPNPIEEGYEEIIALKEELHKIKMKEKDGEFEATKDVFDSVLETFKKNDKRNYDFLIKGGEKFKNSIFKFTKRMIEEEEIPENFDDTTLYNIYKGVGRKEEFSSMRFLHCKLYLPRTVEAVVVRGKREDILASSSCYQIGGQPGHRSQELLFVAKSMIAKNHFQDKITFGDLYDISKFFDKEVVSDTMQTLSNAKIDPKVYRMWALLNRNARIQVRCGGGYSEKENIGPTLGQGSFGASLASQINLDKGITKMFESSTDQAMYGKCKLLPQMYQDDIFSLTNSINASRASKFKVDKVMKTKQLCLNPDKTCYIMFGKTKQLEEARKLLEKEPMMCGSFVVKEKECDKYLGEIFHSESLDRSVLETIKARSGKINAVSREIKAIIEDYRADVVGGALCGLELWRLCVLPSLLASCGTWVEASPATIEVAEQLQLNFLRQLFNVASSCPRPALRSEAGVLSIKHQIYIEKLTLLFHIRNLEQGSLANQVYEQQLEHSWPGLVKEGKEISEKLGIPDITVIKCDKVELKNMVKRAAKEHDEKELKERISALDKLELIKNEDCRRKVYVESMNLSGVRILFRHRVRMTENAENYKGWQKFKGEGAKCKFCSEYDGHSHLMRCKAFEHLRGPGVCLDDDKDLVQYLRQVLLLREEKEQELRSRSRD